MNRFVRESDVQAVVNRWIQDLGERIDSLIFATNAAMTADFIQKSEYSLGRRIQTQIQARTAESNIYLYAKFYGLLNTLEELHLISLLTKDSIVDKTQAVIDHLDSDPSYGSLGWLPAGRHRLVTESHVRSLISNRMEYLHTDSNQSRDDCFLQKGLCEGSFQALVELGLLSSSEAQNLIAQVQQIHLQHLQSYQTKAKGTLINFPTQSEPGSDPALHSK